MNRNLAVGSTTQDLRGAVPFSGEDLEFIILVLELQVGQGLLVIPEVPEFDCSILWSADENVFDLRVELDLRNPPWMPLILVNHLLRRPLLATSNIPETDTRVFASWKDQMTLWGVNARWHFVISLNNLFDQKWFFDVNYLDRMILAPSNKIVPIQPRERYDSTIDLYIWLWTESRNICLLSLQGSLSLLLLIIQWMFIQLPYLHGCHIFLHILSVAPHEVGGARGKHLIA